MFLFRLLEKFMMLKSLKNQGSNMINNVFNNIICLRLYSEQSWTVSPAKCFDTSQLKALVHLYTEIGKIVT